MLHDHVEMFLIFEYVLELEDVGVSKLLVYFAFLQKISDHFLFNTFFNLFTYEYFLCL